MAGLNLAIVGITGAVGQEMLDTVIKRDLPVNRIRFLASERSKGKKVNFKGKEYEVEVLRPDAFEKDEVLLTSAGGSVSQWFAPTAAKMGAIVIDNTSAFRMNPDVPLVVPEINGKEIENHKGIIANPNCSTIQMVLALYPLHIESRIKHIVVATYQSVSGAGMKSILELQRQTEESAKSGTHQGDFKPTAFPYQIAFNLIPQIGSFEANGYTQEEMKMVNETRKILGNQNIMVTATTVRVPVFRGHSEVVYVETEKKISADRARELMAKVPNLVVMDDPANKVYPMPIMCEGKFDTFVGRIREDISNPNALSFWVVSDNLLKGAAFNAVQIAEELIKRNIVKI